nr:PREDICTED: C-type lectin domain family 4 member M-like isoform X2 [Lepisosteus oculatus]
MADIYGNNDFLHIEAQNQFQTGKTQLPSGHQCWDDEESDADYENIEYTLEMKETSQTQERRSQDNSEKRTEEFKSSTPPAAAVAGTKSIILLYVLLLMVTVGWVVFISLAFIKYSALTEEIQHLRKSQAALKESSSSEIQSLKMKQVGLMSNDSQISSAVMNLDSQFQTHVSQMSSRLNSLTSQLQAQGCTKSCSSDWILFSGNCYYFSKETRDWSGAQQYCGNQDSGLAIINNDDELTHLSSKISSIHWLGLTDLDREGSWKWVDGTPVDKKYWNLGEPNNAGEEDCGELKEAKLNDGRCSEIKRWICEKRL